jgi:hypothetical protein
VFKSPKEPMLTSRGDFSANYTVTPPNILVNYTTKGVLFGHIVNFKLKKTKDFGSTLKEFHYIGYIGQ